MLGGGPAGSAAASLLAQWGHSVRLITRAPADARLAVSIPPSTGKLFDAIGISGALAPAGFIRSTGNTVWWGRQEPRVEMFEGGARGWQVPLQALENVLLAAASAAGVAVERRAIVEADLEPDPANFLIDATGRSGLLARALGVRVHDEGPRTVALVASWTSRGPWPVPDDSHTLIESYDSGWAWSVPTSKNTRHIAVMVDPQRSGLRRDAPAREVYEAEIAKTTTFRRLVDLATCAAGPWGWDASTYRATAYAGDHWLLAGDAGSFIDPLSSAGVKKALASGWLAAVAVHSSLVNPALRAHALGFYAQREQEIERHYARMSRQFLAEAAPTHPHAFWRDRLDAPEAPAEADVAAVRQAFQQLRAAAQIRLTEGDVTIESRPVVRGNQVVLEPVIAGEAASVRYVSGVDVIRLRALAPQFRHVPDLYAGYCREHGEVPLPDFLMALATSVARRWLVSQ